MFIKVNARTLNGKGSSDRSGVFGWRRDVDDATASDDEMFNESEVPEDVSSEGTTDSNGSEAEGDLEEAVIEAEPEEKLDPEACAAAAVSASSRRARREPSAVMANVQDFVSWFITEFSITAATSWNGDMRNNLQRHSLSKLRPSPSSRELENRIRAAVAEPAAK
jgi:hypothetical protein